MYREFYKGMDFVHLPIFALLLFMALFAGVVVWMMVIKKREQYEAHAALPLEDGSPVFSENKP